MNEIKEFIKKQGYKYIGKSAFNSDMFEKGNSVIYLNKATFRKLKEKTFKEATAEIHKKSGY